MDQFLGERSVHTAAQLVDMRTQQVAIRRFVAPQSEVQLLAGHRAGAGAVSRATGWL